MNPAQARAAMYLPLSAGLVVAVADFCLRARWIDGAFLNSYPFLSDDGFDWMFQGAALWLHVAGVDREPWPFLRNPLFVFVTAADYGLGWNGRLALLVQSASLGTTVWAAASIARCFRVSVGVTLAGFAAMLGMPLWMIHLWMLSDQLCVALMMLSVERLLAAELTRHRPLIAVAAALATLAGLTQTYGIIAFCAMAGGLAAASLVRRRELRIDLMASAVCVAVITAALLIGWRAAIPHQAGFVQFGSLALSSGMLSFYLNVWAISFVPLLPALFAGAREWRDRPNALQEIVFALGVAIASFAMLTFFYQYRESRYTLFYVPLVIVVLILLAPRAGRGRRIAVASFVGSAVLGALLSWGDIWAPEVKRVGLAPARTWLGYVSRARPVDRFDLQNRCGGRTRFCSVAIFDDVASPYRRDVMREYTRRTLKADKTP